MGLWGTIYIWIIFFVMGISEVVDACFYFMSFPNAVGGA